MSINKPRKDPKLALVPSSKKRYVVAWWTIVEAVDKAEALYVAEWNYMNSSEAEYVPPVKHGAVEIDGNPSQLRIDL